MTAAPHTFSGREEDMCSHVQCRSAQFLFRKGDEQIPALSDQGITSLRLLGGGEEGYVFAGKNARGGACYYKRFFEKQDRSCVLELVNSFADGPECSPGWDR